MMVYVMLSAMVLPPGYAQTTDAYADNSKQHERQSSRKVAQTTLQLNQKNGSYAVTATWTPSGADVDKYSGAGDIDTFKLQAK